MRICTYFPAVELIAKGIQNRPENGFKTDDTLKPEVNII
jgi:hypothetical protein